DGRSKNDASAVATMLDLHIRFLLIRYSERRQRSSPPPLNLSYCTIEIALARGRVASRPLLRCHAFRRLDVELSRQQHRAVGPLGRDSIPAARTGRLVIQTGAGQDGIVAVSSRCLELSDVLRRNRGPILERVGAVSSDRTQAILQVTGTDEVLDRNPAVLE